MTWDDFNAALERLNRAQVRREMDGSLEAEMNYWRARCTVAEIENYVALGLLGRYGENPTDILDRVPASIQQGTGADGTVPAPTENGVLDMLGGSDSSSSDGAPTPETPAAPAVPNN